jgi:hypothetical protein
MTIDIAVVVLEVVSVGVPLPAPFISIQGGGYKEDNRVGYNMI